MKKANFDDKAFVIELLTRSFEDNPSVNYIVRQDNERVDCIRALMNYSFDICMMFGDVWLSDDQKACALVLYLIGKQPPLKLFGWTSNSLLKR